MFIKLREDLVVNTEHIVSVEKKGKLYCTVTLSTKEKEISELSFDAVMTMFSNNDRKQHFAG